jgi:predicted DNA-binding protein (MmcQ/YjbR family)
MSEICLALPEAIAEPYGEHVGFAVRSKRFAYFLEDHHGDGMTAANLKVPTGENLALIAGDPVRFFMPAYLGPKGWVGFRLDLDDVDWEEVAELVDQSYRLVAPRSLVSKLQA